jgi:hypothetical protein
MRRRGWSSSDSSRVIPGTVLVADVERNGVREVDLGVLAAARFRKTGPAGSSTKSNAMGPSTMSSDFEVRIADIMLERGGTAGLAASAAGGRCHGREGRAAPNHPNPFNPTTTIPY